MDQGTLESVLDDLNLPAIRFFQTIDSTNDEAWRWIEAGAPHAGLVIADAQTAGRGRLQRHWITAAGGALAFSLILLAPTFNPEMVTRLTGLGAVAACLALRDLYSIHAEIKWPNDILLDQRKAGGVLVEARWIGENLNAAVIGIGINIAPVSINPDILPVNELRFPATCVNDAVGYPVDRMKLLHDILHKFFSWLPQLTQASFIQVWEDCLAYKDEWVELSVEGGSSAPHLRAESSDIRMGKVIGLAADGSLKLQKRSGEVIIARVGEVQLRPGLSKPG